MKARKRRKMTIEDGTKRKFKERREEYRRKGDMDKEERQG